MADGGENLGVNGRSNLEAGASKNGAVLDRRNFLRELSDLKVNSSKEARDEMRGSLDVPENRSESFFSSAKFGLPKEEFEKVRAMQAESVIASVDGDGFKMEWHEAGWYRDYIVAAQAVSEMKSKFDSPTRAWAEALAPVIDGFARLGALTGNEYSRQYKNEIWKLVKSFGSAAVYGPKGALNFLLGVNRVIGSGVENTASLKTIKIVLGTTKDAASKAKERFVVAMRGSGGASSVPEAKPEMEAYEKYGIADGLRQDFDGQRAKFTAFYGDTEKMKLLTDSNLLKMVARESQQEFDTRISKLFDDGGEIKLLFDDLSAFADAYSKYYEDLGNPEVVKLQNLYLLVARRMVEYVNTLVADEASRNTGLFSYHEGILEHCGELYKGNAAFRRGVLPQLLKSAKYLKESDLADDAGRAKWNGVYAGYQAEMANL